MELAYCLLCGKQAKTSVYKDYGTKYECEDCPRYALKGNAQTYIEVFVKERKDRLKLVKWLKENPPKEDPFRELTKDRIKRILKRESPLKGITPTNPGITKHRGRGICRK